MEREKEKNMKNVSLSSGVAFKTGWAALLLLMIVVIPSAFAHERHYVWNAEYQTLPQGTFEVESITTFKMPDFKKTNANKWEYKGELEYGLTDHITIAHYEHWETKNKSDTGKDSTKYSGFDFEAKYRIGEVGKYWVDPLLYFEIKRDPREKGIPMTLEGKIVLSKDIGKLNVIYNQIMESQMGRKGLTEQAFTFGFNYEVFDSIRLGFETKGQYWNPESHRNELAMGPTLSYVHRYFWVAAGTLFGVNRAADDWQTRLIVGIPIG
jgi:hypothetical protein